MTTVGDMTTFAGFLALVTLGLVALATAVLGLYLLFLVGVACLGMRRDTPVSGLHSRFAILVPAHNEALLIGRLLESLNAQAYPRDRFDVFVVADNCTDDTAAIAAARGARSLERFDRMAIGKGFALRWLLQQVRKAETPYDAFVVFDADSVVAPGFLAAMDARLERGAQVVQGYYSVLNAQDSPLAMLRFAALASLHYLRPLAREVLGLSCGLKGNGMCFRSDVMDRFDWKWFTLAEDVEFHLALVREGVRVQFAPDARVDADMPVSFSQAASQNARWERGRLQLAKHRVPDLVGLGIPETRWLRMDAAIEQLIPPLSVPFAAGGVCLLVGIVTNAWWMVALAAIGLLGQTGHLLAGMMMIGASPRAYAVLAYAPLYIVWKVGIYARALVSTRTMSWIRTARVDGELPSATSLRGAPAHRDVV